MIKGFLPGTITILAGVTSSGKTTFLGNIAANIAVEQNKKVLIYSLESGHAITAPIHSIYGDEEIENLKIVAPDVGISYLEIEAHIRSNLHLADIIFIDHIHYLVPDLGEQMQAKIGVLIRNFQTLARDIETPVVIVAHTRKLISDSAIPTLNDLKDSSALFQDPDCVIFVHRFKKNAQEIAVNSEQLFANNGLVIVAKNRQFQTTGTLKLEGDPDNKVIAVQNQWADGRKVCPDDLLY
ncbi:hypothetical protein A2W24_05970 [Microgenomates group bacterium RBG_16_45_19]|nr:MAG: hypothetical protein A2W24_05970 [Microgenomates group bacterium RBG_16_45_19]